MLVDFNGVVLLYILTGRMWYESTAFNSDGRGVNHGLPE